MPAFKGTRKPQDGAVVLHVRVSIKTFDALVREKARILASTDLDVSLSSIAASMLARRLAAKEAKKR